MIELLNIDCMDYMRGVPDKYFDLAIVDPPYGVDIENRKDIKAAAGKIWDYKTPDENYFKELFRISERQIIWGMNRFLDYLPNCTMTIIWDKENGENYVSDYELAWCNLGYNRSRIFRMFWISNMIPPNEKPRIHSCQKPIKLYKWLLNNYAFCSHCHNEGSFYEDVVGDGGSKMLVDCEWCNVAENGVPKIFDSHLGSGSIAIACHDMKFDLVGCEIDKDYYEAAVKRFENHKKQLTIF